MRALRSIGLAIALLLPGCAAQPPARDTALRQFTFSWPFIAGGKMAPRGGSTAGVPITLDTVPSAAWEALHAPGLRDRDRDRRAILAMAGIFRASFEFIEVIGFRPGFTPDRPYQSWGTEWVYVLHDDPRFVSLQHLLVMSMQMPDGHVEGPIVTKHWRQDWRYEDRDLLVYRGRNTWEHERLTSAQARGTWSQSVSQVDDSPRYESYGRWDHRGNVATWRSAETWRPLPRREFSVRSDYQVLVGTNRYTITPTGWVQEEDNLKVTLNAAGAWQAADPVVSKESGLNRYERLRDFDLNAGEQYRARTAAFWELVRARWDELAAHRSRLVLRGAADQQQLFVPLFEYAERLAGGETVAPDAMREFVHTTVSGYLADLSPRSGL